MTSLSWVPGNEWREMYIRPYGGSLLDRGIELPQERDMAVRMIDVPAAGRDWDRGG